MNENFMFERMAFGCRGGGWPLGVPRATFLCSSKLLRHKIRDFVDFSEKEEKKKKKIKQNFYEILHIF
ncbi:hypothetical protein JXB28_00155 [Candidatus Woesearchaeota archaeon]|nr:hypothetical protein [Candidatus Woesearchaeota archaeon]